MAEGPLRGVRTLAVPAFTNQSREPGVAALVTRAMRELLAAGGRFRLASDGRADAVLVGTVHDVSRMPAAFGRDPRGATTLSLYQASVSVSVSIKRSADGKILASLPGQSLSASFLLGPDVLATEANRERALRSIASELMRRLADVVSDAF